MEILSRDNPKLLRLEDEYLKLNWFSHSNWSNYANSIDVQHFRGENGYLSQLNYGMTAERYAATYDYLVRAGEQENIIKLGEDNAFGAVTFTAPDGTVYSRDLLDSVSEIRFIRETLGLTDKSSLKLLDIGSGYGRLLHRWCQTFPEAQAFGLDAIPLSTFLCDYYLNFRGLDLRAFSVPLTAANDWSLHYSVIASNVYSFAECTLSTIDFWIKFCADRLIPYFFLCPHDYGQTDGAFVSRETDGRNLDYLPLFEQYGYRVLRRTHKYLPREDSPKYAWGTEFVMLKRGT